MRKKNRQLLFQLTIACIHDPDSSDSFGWKDPVLYLASRYQDIR